MFLDLGERNLIGGQNLKRGPMLGRGAFGFVYRAAASVSGNGGLADVAMKMLQPVDPGAEARTSIIQLYKVSAQKAVLCLFLSSRSEQYGSLLVGWPLLIQSELDVSFSFVR